MDADMSRLYAPCSVSPLRGWSGDVSRKTVIEGRVLTAALCSFASEARRDTGIFKEPATTNSGLAAHVCGETERSACPTKVTGKG